MQLHGADHLVALLEADHLPVGLGEDLGVDPLDHALPGAERQPGTVGPQRAEGQHPLTRLEHHELRHRVGAGQVGVVGRRGQRGQLQHPEADDATGAGEQTDLAAGGGPHRRHDHVVLGPAAAAPRQLVRRRARHQPLEER